VAVHRPALRLGQDNDEVLGWLPKEAGAAAPTGAGIEIRPTSGRAGRTLLEGVRVLEITTNWAGPAGAREFARLGADVIIVEWSGKSGASAAPHGVISGLS